MHVNLTTFAFRPASACFQMQTTTCSSFLALLCGNRPSCDRHQRQVVRSIWSRQFPITPCASCPVLSLSLSPPSSYISSVPSASSAASPARLSMYLCTYVSTTTVQSYIPPALPPPATPALTDLRPCLFLIAMTTTDDEGD